MSSSLLDYLDSLPDSECSASPSALSSCPSPDLLRGADSSDLDWTKTCNVNPDARLGYKNSTLMETSKAMDINMLPQPANVSDIFQPSPKDHQMHQSKSEMILLNESPEKRRVSTIVAGKAVCKIKTQKEKTPKGNEKSSSTCHARPEKKLLGGKSTPRQRYKCKKRVNFCSPAATQVPASTHAGANSQAGPAVPEPPPQGVLLSSTPFTCPEGLLWDLSPVCMSPTDEELIPNASGPFVHTSELAPCSAIPREERPRDKVSRITSNICSVIRAPLCCQTFTIRGIQIDKSQLPPRDKIPRDILLDF